MIKLDNSMAFVNGHQDPLKNRLRILLNVIALSESSSASVESKTGVYNDIIKEFDIPQNVLVGLKWALERDAAANRKTV